MRQKVVFDTKEGYIGIKRVATKKEEKVLKTNYVVDILDPMTYKTLITVEGFGSSAYKWRVLPKTDPRYKFYNLFNIIECGIAEWEYNGYQEGEGIVVDEAVIINRYEVFDLVRKLFEAH